MKMNNYYFGSLSKQRLEGVKPIVKKIAELALTKSVIDFGIAWMGGHRTPDEQQELYKSGASTKDGFVKLSKHQKGEAIDILPYIVGKPCVEEKHLYFMIYTAFYQAALELGVQIRLGVDWDMDFEFLSDQSFDDYPHIEFLNI